MGDPPISINDTYRLGDLSTAPRFSRQTGLTLLEVYQTLEAQDAIWRLPEAFLGFWGSYIISKSSHNTRMFCSKSHWLRVEVPTSSSLSLTCTCRVILWFAGSSGKAVPAIPASSSLAAWFGKVLLRPSQFDFLFGKNQTHIGASGKIWDPHQVTMVKNTKSWSNHWRIYIDLWHGYQSKSTGLMVMMFAIHLAIWAMVYQAWTQTHPYCQLGTPLFGRLQPWKIAGHGSPLPRYAQSKASLTSLPGIWSESMVRCLLHATFWGHIIWIQ